MTSYNNFYEFGVGKDDPSRRAGSLTTKPWTVKIDGLVNKPADYALEDIVKPVQLYRMHAASKAGRWSSPWVGFPLSEVIKRADPLGSASTSRSRRSCGQGDAGAGRLPAGAGMALRGGPASRRGHAPAHDSQPSASTAKRSRTRTARRCGSWCRGSTEVQGIKSIVGISLVEKEPPTSWNKQAPQEYGFYANVNPSVDHPRWSQATGRRIGESGIFVKRRPTLLFNGYADQVASLYAGMDLKKFY